MNESNTQSVPSSHQRHIVPPPACASRPFVRSRGARCATLTRTALASVLLRYGSKEHLCESPHTNRTSMYVLRTAAAVRSQAKVRRMSHQVRFKGECEIRTILASRLSGANQ